MSELEIRAQWRSFTSYVCVTTGALVGLSNVLQFPFLVVKYGGLFVLFYVICQLSIALPLLFAELLIGRRGEQNPVGSIGILTMEANANRHWRKLGWLCILVTFSTMIYYTVLAAFPMGYFIDNVKDIYHQAATLHSSVQLSNNAVESFARLETWFVVFLLIAMVVVCRGIHRGLEEISMMTVPFYFIILLSLAIYISTLGYFGDTLKHLFTHHSDVSLYEIFFMALAFAFMKYKTGMGVMIVYGSYLPYHVSLTTSTLCVVVIDVLISIFSYFIVFPLTLAYSPDAALTALSSHNVIYIFSGLPGGLMISAIFFFAAILIVWTPIIAMAETIVITFIERLHWSRTFASGVLFLLILMFGSFEVATHLQWADIKVFGGYHLHDFLKGVVLNILMPLSAFFIAIFVGWVMSRCATEDELHFKPIFYNVWRCLIRYIVPIAIFLILFTVVLGKLTF